MRLKVSLSIALAMLCVFGIASAAPPPALQPVEGRVIWVDFWASWCVPCRRSFPWLNSMHRKYGGEGLQVIGVNLDKDRALADAFLASEARVAQVATRLGQLLVEAMVVTAGDDES